MKTEISPRQGPLAGLKGVLLGGIGPAPYAAMLLADLGAQITRVERPGSTDAGNPLHPPIDPFSRGQDTIELDLRSANGCDAVWTLIDSADFLIEGFRPGVLERLGFAPDLCHGRNPGLVIARITGWGQEGPLADSPGHDINYLALSGALGIMPTRNKSGGRSIPLNLLADFAGGGLWSCFGILAAIHERSRSGLGQVVDAAMVDGVHSLMGMAFNLNHFGNLADEPGASLLDGGSHFYDTYKCSDGGEVAVGAVEPQFYKNLCEVTGLSDAMSTERFDSKRWAILKGDLGALIKTKTRAQWCSDLGVANACITPVLKLREVADHPHHIARKSFMSLGNLSVPVPGPRFSRTPAQLPAGYSYRLTNSIAEQQE